MDLDSGPDSRVRVPGASDREESSEVANVRVTKGRLVTESDSSAGSHGRLGASLALSASGKCNVSAMM